MNWLGWYLIALGALVLILTGTIVWPMLGRGRDDFDPHGEAFGDQPRLPQPGEPS